MKGLLEIETALQNLPPNEKWEIARWLLDSLEETALGKPQANAGVEEGRPGALPDYAARRRRIFGNAVMPNMVLEAREQERW